MIDDAFAHSGSQTYIQICRNKQNYMAEQLKNSDNHVLELTKASPAREVEKIKLILEKQAELRSGSENQQLANFIRENTVLLKLAEQISFQFTKNLFKAATILTLKKDTVIYMAGEKVDDMGIVMAGQLAILHNEQPVEESVGVSNDDIFDKLLENAKMYTRQLRKKQSSIVLEHSNKKAHPNYEKTFSPISMLMDEPVTAQHVESYVNQNEYFGFKDRSMGSNFTRTCVCLNDQTVLLLFKESNVMVSLEAALKEKIKKIASILKTIPCFGVLDIDRLNLVIQSMNLRKRKKFEYVYRQGDKSTSFYLLTEGEIKITKETNLFEENPNILYGDRRKLVEESLIENRREVDKVERMFIDKKVKKSMLPYANLTSMYNYRPLKKLIEIGVVTPPTLFGEEEFCERKDRDTNAMCFSLTAEYYELGLARLQEIVGNKLMPLFEKELRDLVRRKVLYRQSQYANSIHLENNNNLDYFYLEDGKEKESPRKFKITKFNNIIESKKSSPQKKQDSSSATFTTFNFNRMRNLNQTERRRKKSNFDPEEDQQYEKDANELKIMHMTHTWKLMKQKVDMEIKASQKISPFKPTINLKKPLIASDYFYHVEKESRRIEREHRKRIASLSRSYRISRVTDKSAVNL